MIPHLWYIRSGSDGNLKLTYSEAKNSTPDTNAARVKPYGGRYGEREGTEVELYYWAIGKNSIIYVSGDGVTWYKLLRQNYHQEKSYNRDRLITLLQGNRRMLHQNVPF